MAKKRVERETEKAVTGKASEKDAVGEFTEAMKILLGYVVLLSMMPSLSALFLLSRTDLSLPPLSRMIASRLITLTSISLSRLSPSLWVHHNRWVNHTSRLIYTIDRPTKDGDTFDSLLPRHEQIYELQQVRTQSRGCVASVYNAS